MKNYLKKNLFSFVIGCILGIPLSIYAVNHQTPATIPVYYYISDAPIYLDNTEQVNITERPPELEVYEMTAEELAEEEYFDSLELLALCVEAEAGNQGLTGKKLVVDVVLNRVDDPDYPDNITDVIMQRNQFSVVLDGRIWKMEPTKETFQAIQEELENRTNSRILFFTAEGFSPYGTAWKKVGDHYFSTK